ncbi:DUF6090 family protein [uncultured Eudoraea sp.]|uniref:DUF6090 family protein n=1 Tax=uncultured Eudoraea sp. TaxID=1035614 RepID=UPI00260451B8|nr:DUF6090 family protein [uncultured Eudoraea sp.]
MKLFQAIRRQLIQESNVKKYLLYAIGEILLVMIGITLAFQVDNWNDNREKKIEEIRTYENIREQILGDKEHIQGQIDYNNRFLVQFEYARKIVMENDRIQMDTLASIIAKLTSYSDYDREGNIYETMVNSGKIQLLRNQDIVNHIRLLEQRYNYVNRMENIHYDVIMGHVAPGITPSINFSTTEIVMPERIFNNEFQNLIFLLVKIMHEKDNTYKTASDEIDKITALIDEELNKG